MKIDHIQIDGFKSIKHADLQLRNINILIGPNGAGKSNFIQFMNLLNNIGNQNLQNYVATNSGADNLLHFGRKRTGMVAGKIRFGKTTYEFELTPTNDNSFFFSKESVLLKKDQKDNAAGRDISSGNTETNLIKTTNNSSLDDINVSDLKSAMTALHVYHFHDTSGTAKVKLDSDVHDNRKLRYDASNLAAFLYYVSKKHTEYFTRIENSVKLIAPFFERFQLQPLALNSEKIRLEWKQKGSDSYFHASGLSDGTLRMICLITLLMQPDLPDTIIIDEPELGLHPAAIAVLASLIKVAASSKKQIICTTQSVTFLNHFSPQDIIVVDRNNGESVFKRLQIKDLSEWLDEYSIGELWEKNLLGGRP